MLVDSFLTNLFKSWDNIVNNVKRFIYSLNESALRFSFLLLFLFLSCEQLTPKNEKVIARVGEIYLYASDLEGQLTAYNNRSDSLLKTRNFIDSWAKSQLLIQLAEQNLKNEALEDLEELVKNYRNELYANTYLQSVVNTSLDTLVSTNEIDSFLIANNSAFKLNAPLYKARFIHLPPDNVDQFEIQRSFERFNQKDQLFLDSLSFQFYDFLLSDSIWLNRRDLINEIAFLSKQNPDQYLKKSQFFRVEDSLGVYLLYIKEFLEKGATAPRSLVESTIENIIRNQKKLKFIKQFEKEILQDAIKSKNYETY
ncbi:MAG: peptidyl-prolyl cis-trans isomerase [Flavobacteriaceae bacterium]